MESSDLNDFPYSNDSTPDYSSETDNDGDGTAIAKSSKQDIKNMSVPL